MIEVELADRNTIQYILQRFHLRTKHRLGQNFLIRPDVVSRIAEAAELSEGTPVLEIGPGIGTLTQGLARTGAAVTAVEIDENLQEVLEHTLAPYENVRILYQDILKTDLNALMEGQTWHVAANLPYYITTPILLHLIQSGLPIDVFVFMMQREVADRILAVPGGKEYGALTIAVQYYCTVERVMDVSPTSFVPRPAVTSTVLKMRKRKTPAVETDSPKLFFRMVKMAFAQRRKIFSNSLKNGGLSPELAAAILEETGIDGKRRGETFSMEEFAALSNAWYKLAQNEQPADM